MAKVFFHPAVLTSSSSYGPPVAHATESPSNVESPFIEIDHPQFETLHITPESRWVYLHLNVNKLHDSAGINLSATVAPNSAYSHAIKECKQLSTIDGSEFDYRKTAIFAVSKSRDSMLLAIPYNLLSLRHNYDSPTEGSKPQAPSPLAKHGFNQWEWHGVVRLGTENDSAGMQNVLKDILSAHAEHLLGICDAQGYNLLHDPRNTFQANKQNVVNNI
jgi:hypothetical protein